MNSRTFITECKVLRRLTKRIQQQEHPLKHHLHVYATSSCVLTSCMTNKHHFRQGQKHGSFTSGGPLLNRNNTFNMSKRSFIDKTNNSIHKADKERRQLSYLHVKLKLSPKNTNSQPNRGLSLSPKKILEASPPFVQPYLRLVRFDKPIGSFLLFWPCTWSIGLAAEAGHLPDLYILTLFGMGSFLMRGAGCIINDMWDRDIDRKVERTKMRPLASGELSPFQALVFLGGNLSLSLAILLQLNWYSVILGASSMILVIAYPLAKRYTYWPQVLLGVTFNFGAMLGWCAVKGMLDWPIVPLYAGCLLWTLIYDTIYAHQDKYDDMLIGVKSSALKLGDKTKPWLAGFTGIMVSSLALTGHMCDQTWPYYVALVATAAHLSHQLYTVDLDNPDSCFSKFKSNSQLGAVMFMGIVLSTLVKPKKKDEDEEKVMDA